MSSWVDIVDFARQAVVTDGKGTYWQTAVYHEKHTDDFLHDVENNKSQTAVLVLPAASAVFSKWSDRVKETPTMSMVFHEGNGLCFIVHQA